MFPEWHVKLLNVNILYRYLNLPPRLQPTLLRVQARPQRIRKADVWRIQQIVDVEFERTRPGASASKTLLLLAHLVCVSLLLLECMAQRPVVHVTRRIQMLLLLALKFTSSVLTTMGAGLMWHSQELHIHCGQQHACAIQ